MATTEKNKQQIRKLFDDCLNHYSPALLKELVADEYTNPRGERGPAAFGVSLEMLHAGFPDIHYEVEDVVADGDRVAARWRWKGTHKGAFAGYPPSGRAVTNDGMAIFQLRDGKIVNSWLQTDRLGFLQELGVVSRDVGALPGARPR
jgi:steroid delta-isomerase-like uncharacterized protein